MQQSRQGEIEISKRTLISGFHILEDRRERIPLVPILPSYAFERSRPKSHRLGEIVFPRAIRAHANNRLAHNDLVSTVTQANDEERIDWRRRDQRKNEWTAWQGNFSSKEFYRCRGDIVHHAIALNGNDLSIAQCVKQIERKRRALGVVIYFYRARAGLFQRQIDMLCAAFIRLGRADHANRALEFFGEQRCPEIVTSHMGGENNCALRREQIVQEIGAA